MPALRYVPIALMLGMACTIIGGCGKRPASPPAVPPSPKATAPKIPPSAKLGMRDYWVYYPQQGPRTWAAKAKSMDVDTATGLLTMHDIVAKLYTQGQETLQMTADSGQAAVAGHTVRMSLSGHIAAIRSDKQMSFQADRVRWNSADGLIHAQPVRWHGLGFDQRADTGVFTVRLFPATFSGHVHMAASALSR